VDDLPNELLHRAGFASGYDARDNLGLIELAVDDFSSHRHGNSELL
jgi:hypothetical protein